MRCRSTAAFLATSGLALALLLFAASGARASDPYDVVVVGAGPGGLVAALSTMEHLSKSPTRGSDRPPRILVLEKRGPLPQGADLHDREALRGSAFGRTQVVGVRPEVASVLRDLGVSLDGRRAEVVDRNPPHRNSGTTFETYPVALNELQTLLMERARERGVEVRFGSEVREISERRNKEVTVSIDTGNGERARVRARWVVAAPGTSPKLAEAVGIRTTEPEPQGIMAGVWFEGFEPRPGIVLGEHRSSGGAVLLSDGKQLYGLFALPRDLEAMVRRARTEDRPLNEKERARIMRHGERVARPLLPESQRDSLASTHVQPFEVTLRRALSVVSSKYRTLVNGDFVQMINPYTGSGANAAMVTGHLAGKTLAEVERSPSERAAKRALRRFERESLRVAREAIRESREYRSVFPAHRDARAPRRQLRREASHREGVRSRAGIRRGRSMPRRAR